MSTDLPNVSAVVATRNRAAILRRTLDSLAKQSLQPAEIVIVDGSDGSETKMLCDFPVAGLSSKLRWLKATERGAGAQRNQGVMAAVEATIWFFDDDVTFDQQSAARLWEALQGESVLGGVSAIIKNQSYHSPGRVSRCVFRLLHGSDEESFAGKVIGPAVNLLPENDDRLPDVVPVEWLNTTCTMYRREALPNPVFDPYFTGYSLMEDLALSIRVSQRGWKLANARRARIVHDSQPGEHKNDASKLAAMELRNRRYVMTEVLQRRRPLDYIRLGLWECFTVASTLTSGPGWRNFPRVLSGKIQALLSRAKPATKASSEIS